MARHRSPQGRRAHLRPPLPAAAAAGVGAHRLVPVQQLTSSLPVRFVATAVAGSALAVAGQHALTETLPAAADAANILRLGAAPPAVAAVPEAPLSLAAAEPAVADVAELVKAADLQRAAAEAAAQAAAQPAAAQPAAAPPAAPPVAAPAPADQGLLESAARPVQMIVGRVTSAFGSRWGAFHEGLDIAAPIGTPIRAPVAGTVIDSGPATGFGLWVRLRHADGTVTVYGHLNRSLVDVGEKVAAGEVIAEVGNRGRSTGPHLHIEVVTPNGNKINPRRWLDGHGIGY